MTEENKSLQSPQNEPEPEAEPVDTAAAMQYFEASEAAAEVGREILASRKPKKQKQKKKRGSKRLKVKRKPSLKYSRQMQTVSVSSVKRVQTRQCLRSRVWRHLKRLQTARQRKSSFRQNCSHLRGL